MGAFPIILFCFTLSLIVTVLTAIDTLNTTQPLKDGQTIVSAGGKFELGFFTPDNSVSKNRYLGIWYGLIAVKTVVWVANREVALNDSSGVLKITSQGSLVILNHNANTIWSSNSSVPARNPIAQLLDSGNLIVKDEGRADFLWQSFDYPGDTVLPGMKLGRSIENGMEWYLSSWKASDDPSPGNFTFRLDPHGYPEYYLRKDSIKQYRLGPWNGIGFSGAPLMQLFNPLYSYQFVFNDEEIYSTFHFFNTSKLVRMLLNPDGSVTGNGWIESTQNWANFKFLNIDDCDNYARCGVYGSCNALICGCLKGFVPKSAEDRNTMGSSNGCVRKTPLNCSTDGFLRYSGMKLPETQKSSFNRSINLDECKNMCKKNCTCTAYATLNISEGGSGCLLWFDDLVDLRQLNENGQDIYIRMAASEVDKENGDNSQRYAKKRLWIIVLSVSLTGVLLLGLALVSYVRTKKYREKMTRTSETMCLQEDLELPLFDLHTITSATNNFSDSNKLGKGGFGHVYKGQLEDGREIAVKRLSKSSRQGPEEFKNEVKYIAKLQHRNLVKLLGCCIQSDEKLLVYEFMPNKSLDFYIFDQTLSQQLTWSTRYHIINGIARGLVYLHQDSRLKIIHRDLKAGNILLDNDMNPKISDFGLARSFEVNESHANTNKVVGTYGYMSPEYAIDGHYSTKSDVYSFGVMVLEIVSGKKNRGFRHLEHNLNLLGHAWILYKEGRSLELIVELMKDSCNISEALRTIHIALLCVQRNPEDRPSMSSVILMLGGEGTLPEPNQPGFFTERDIIEANSSSNNHKPCSANNLTITLLDAR